jgi:hypothetical protein
MKDAICCSSIAPIRFESAGLRYRDGDLRWRHAGVRNGQVHLFDLGSLEKFPDAPGEVNNVGCSLGEQNLDRD